MTLKELFGCLVLCACGVMTSVPAGRHFGFLRYLIGFPTGFLGTALALFGVGWLYLYLCQAGPHRLRRLVSGPHGLQGDTAAL